MSRMLVSFTLLMFFASMVSASEVKLLLPRYNITGLEPDDFECVSARASDYYGIGVRLGIYFSWWTAWVANAAVEEEIFFALDQNTVFLFATIAALVRCTITSVLTQLDCLIMIHLGTGTIFGVMSIWGYRTCAYSIEGPNATRHFGGLGTHFRLLLSASVSAFSVWFWYSAVEPGSPDLNNDVGPCAILHTFMFTDVQADGGIRIFYIFTNIVATIYFCVHILAAIIPGCVKTVRLLTMSKLERFRTASALRVSVGLNHKQLRYLYYSLRIFNFVFLIWSMVLVEYTLIYNHVQEVLGPGGRIYFPSQLIPMIIGAFTFCRVVYKRIEKARESDEAPEEGEKTLRSLKRISSGKDAIKILGPLTYVARPVKKVPPVDADIDERMKHEHIWIRCLVSVLPWLSLLPRWNEKGTQKSVRPLPDEEGKPDPCDNSEAPKDVSEDVDLSYKTDFSNTIPDESISQAMSRFSVGGTWGEVKTIA